MMIVEPDFLEHWKTRLLVDRTKDEAAPLMLLRLWAHCQTRRRWTFKDMTGEVLAVICRSKLDGPQLLNVLKESGFIETNGQTVVVHDWDVSNRMLISAWKNGSKGGRPTKTDRKPGGNPSANRRQTDPSSLSSLSVLSSDRVRERFKEWIPIRKAQGKKPKDWDAMFSEQCKFLSQFNEADQLESISASIRNNWQGLFQPKKDRDQKKPDPRQDRLDREFEEAKRKYG